MLLLGISCGPGRIANVVVTITALADNANARALRKGFTDEMLYGDRKAMYGDFYGKTCNHVPGDASCALPFNYICCLASFATGKPESLQCASYRCVLVLGHVSAIESQVLDGIEASDLEFALLKQMPDPTSAARPCSRDSGTSTHYS